MNMISFLESVISLNCSERIKMGHQPSCKTKKVVSTVLFICICHFCSFTGE